MSTSVLRVRRFRLGAAALALTAVVGASASLSDASRSAGPLLPAGSTSTGAIAATPRSDVRQGGTIRWAIAQTPPNFNPYQIDGSYLETTTILGAVLPKPFHLNGAGVATLDTDYFTSIRKTAASPQTIVYTINPKAQWSDGTPITWRDLHEQWAALNGSNSRYLVSGTEGYDRIASVRMGSRPRQAVVTFRRGFADWRSLFSPLVPRSLTATPAAFNRAWTRRPLVTAGPFAWGSRNDDLQTYTVKADPAWWGDRAKLDRIVFVVYNDPNAAIQALGTGQLDYDDLSFGDEVGNVRAAGQYTGVEVRQGGGWIYRQFILNTKASLLTDRKVRQAVVLGVDRATIASRLMGGLGGTPRPMQNHLFLSGQAGYERTCGHFCSYDPAAARALLRGDGWRRPGTYFTKNGRTLSLTITIPSDTPNSAREARLAQASLKQAGIRLRIKVVPTDDFFPKYIIPGDFQLTTFTWITTAFPVGGSLEVFRYDPRNVGQNYGSGGSAEINRLLTSAVAAPSTSREADLANDASRLMWGNASWLPLYEKPQAAGVRSALVNLGANGIGDIRFENIGFHI